MTRRRVDDPALLADIFSLDPGVHLYGLPDLEEPYWSLSEWWHAGDIAVGVVGFPGTGAVTAYAMSQHAPGATLELLAEVIGPLRPGTLTTGPRGLAQRIAGERQIIDLGLHWRLIHDGREVPPAAPGIADLGPGDVVALDALHRTDPGAAFFLPHMLETGHFVGLWEGDRLVASAGTHVTSRRFGVAAIGAVITDPRRRREGLGRMVTEALTAGLVERYPTVGLNVSDDNKAAGHLYESLGFERRFGYEEVELR